jgi:hypothetical protein
VYPAAQVDETHVILMASKYLPVLQTQPFSRATPVASATSEHLRHTFLLIIHTYPPAVVHKVQAV